jgi:replicative DNA helicase
LRQLDPEPKTVTIIGGGTGVSKTALISTVVCETMYRNGDLDSVLFVNTDQSPHSLFEREISRVSGIRYDDVHNNDLLNEDYHRRINKQIEKINLFKTKSHFFDCPPYQFEAIEKEAERVKAQILVLDHVQSILCGKDDQNPIDRLSKLMSAVLQLAQAKGIAVICASALNRQGAARSRYTSADVNALRGSSTIEYLATKIWMLRQTGKGENGKYPCILEGKKDKEAAQLDIPLTFDGPFMRFEVGTPDDSPDGKSKSKSTVKTKRRVVQKSVVNGDGGTFAK